MTDTDDRLPRVNVKQVPRTRSPFGAEAELERQHLLLLELDARVCALEANTHEPVAMVGRKLGGIRADEEVLCPDVASQNHGASDESSEQPRKLPNPDAMHGAADGFPGSDFSDGDDDL